ncbi:MAG: glycosyltransferase [Chloroflexi bacterium]|nr:glycosyltransferase [Chloroflexota bacterium]
MKIAFLTPYLPFPPDTGGKMRSFHLIKQLARCHELNVFSVYHGADEPAQADGIRALCVRLVLVKLVKSWRETDRARRMLSALPRSVDHFQTPESLLSIRAQLQSGGYDLVFVDELVMAAYTAGLHSMRRILSQQKIDFWHYYETAAARPWGKVKLLDYIESLKLRRFQARALRDAYDLHLVCSRDDERMLSKLRPETRFAIMPNGVDTAYFAPRADWPTDGETNAPTLVYSGTMHYYPNIDAVLYFWREIYPRLLVCVPDVRILIVGHQPPPEILRLGEHPNVVVTGSVPDVRPYLARSTAMFVPLRLGGGTRLKILEAMAMGVPVISTTIGCQGLNVEDGLHIVVADDPEVFAAKAAALLVDRDLQHRLSASARELSATYDWSRLVHTMLNTWQTR